MDKNHFKNTCVFAACGIICITLLGISAVTIAKSVYSSDTNTLHVELDDRLYQGLLSLPLSSDTKNLYVVLNGEKYPVFESGDEETAVQNTERNDLCGLTDEMPSVDSAKTLHGTANTSSGRVYHIIWGDTLSELALEFGSTVDELAVYNHISDPNLIYAEDDLYLP